MIAKEILKKSEAFAGLKDSELDKVAASALDKEFESGTTLFHEGDSAEELLVVEEGRIALQINLPKTGDQIGRRITVDVAGKNDVIGWSVVVEPHRYTSTAICLQKAKVISISGNKLRWLLEDNPAIGYAVLKGLMKVVAARLDDTRKVLVSERLLTQAT